MNRQKTKVIFYNDGHEIFAYFPKIDFDSLGNKMSYSHIGQHSACSPEYIDQDHIMYAVESEYIYLLKELEFLGYNLEVSND